jgi:hypothetical protein
MPLIGSSHMQLARQKVPTLSPGRPKLPLMPTVKVSRADVSRDEVMEALRQELGSEYKVKAGNHDGVFSVDKGTFTGAKVHMKPEGEVTAFHVHGTGLIIGRIINELTTARLVASAIARAPLAQA